MEAEAGGRVTSVADALTAVEKTAAAAADGAGDG